MEHRLSARASAMDASGIRRVFDLARTLTDPINLSIGQPDFPVPQAMKDAAIEAIRNDQNGYTVTQGIEPLRSRIARYLGDDLGWTIGGETGLLITSGTSGALTLAALALLDPGDEIVIPDPYFVCYPHLGTIAGARAVACDTYPDFALTAERVEGLLTDRTRAVLLNTPANPTGHVATRQQCRDLLDLCASRGVLLISDEIYDAFCYRESRSDTMRTGDVACCPSPARFDGAHEHVLLIRGFGKSYGPTGWRMGYCAGPRPIIEAMARIQQYTFVCAPSIAQHGCVPALDCDISGYIDDYERRRDLVFERMRRVTNLARPGGAFYAFCEIPDHLGLSDQEFCERCIERNVLVIPGSVFSSRTTHFRISFATRRESLERGLGILGELMSV